MKNFILIFLLVVFAQQFELHAQELSAPKIEKIRDEIKNLDAQEQEAFKNGDCDKVVTFFDENVTFYANSRKVPSLEFLLNFCKRVSRPFEKAGKINDEFYVLSETTAYAIKRIDFEPEKQNTDSIKREVVTKVWSKKPDGWKIVHFHSSVANVPKQ